MTLPIRIDTKKLAASGLPAHLQTLIVQLANLANRPAIKGAPGRGIQGITSDPESGALTIALSDGTAVQTGSLRGRSTYDLAVMLGYAGTLAEWIETQRGVSFEALEQTIMAEESATQLIDGSRRVLALKDGQGAVVADLVRLLGDGLDFVPAATASDRMLAKGAVDAAGADVDSGRVTRTLNGQPLERLYPDGIDMKPSQRFIDRLPPHMEQAGKDGILAVDLFSARSGHRYPSAQVDGVARKASIISVYGQSNADMTEMDDPPVWSTPPMPNHVLMLNDITGARGGLRGWMGVAAPATSSLIPASETATSVPVQSYGAAAAARLNALCGAPFRVFAVRASSVGGQKLVGDTPTAGIWKGSTGAHVQSWLNWTQDIRNMRDSLLGLGYEIEGVHICFTHQEADWQTPRATYASRFADMKAEREAILATDLPGVPARWFVDQASGSGRRTGGYLGGAWQSRLAIQDAVLSDPVGNITMVMPRYAMQFGRSGGTQEDIHHAFHDRVLQGETYAHAMREIMAGRPWRCPWPISAAISGNDVIVDFDSLLPLVLDPTFCKVRADLGFGLWTGTAHAAASDVRLTGQRQVTISFPTAPAAGQRIRYAYRQYDGQDVLDSWPIATGALRDAWQAPSLFLPGNRLLRPALGFELQL